MSLNECCKNCNHCILGRSSDHGWCLLRRIKVHPDIAQFVFCHHWIKREPSLPLLEEKHLYFDKQLDFGKTLATLDN